ncbi:hypothetical protein [Zongyangia hominis]|uniref:Uncharacterized protein n=1 Tax=Zongyangia hominis TaxID=2763677 RepID=A0A926EDA7_9FIRM|nr:hypothetical protein [Zongyangia hominis]MBC8569652.1 hypothetical protein [Zongyangia hominis]
MWKTMGKAAAAIAAFFLVIFLSRLWGSGFCQWMQREHPSLLYQYASGGKFSGDVYFSEEVLRQTGVPQTLTGISLEKDLIGRAGQISREQWEIAHHLAGNPIYLAHLRQMGTSLSELFSFYERLAGVQDGLIYACRYLLFLMWVVFLHLLMRCRPALYFAMGALCILATCIKLSGKLASVCLFGSSTVNQFLSDGLLPPLLEAMLTFLIFDITIASMEKVRLGHKVESLYRDLPALETLIVHLSGAVEVRGEYRSDFSRLLPNFHDYLSHGKRTRKKALRLMQAIESLGDPHTNRTFLEAAVELRTLLPGK